MEHQKKTFFFTVFFVHRIVLFCGFLRAPNRAFFWFSSCTKSCFFLVFFVHQIVLFSGFLRAPNRVFFWFSSCTKSCYNIYIYIVSPWSPHFCCLKLCCLLHPLALGLRNDFVEADGSLPVAGAEEIIPTINKLVNEWLDSARKPSSTTRNIRI